MADPEDIREAQRATWAVVASGWEKHFPWWDAATQPLQQWYARAVAFAPGQQVLDVACGSGVPSLMAARRVSPGKVVAIDLSPDMLAVTERHARRAGLANVELHEMDGQSLRFPEATFDAVTCNLGLMFCPDPAQALGGFLRVLKPGGRLAAVVWDEPPKNPFFTTIGAELAKLVPQPPPDPEAPGPFRLAPPGKLQGLLHAAGFTDVAISGCPLLFELPSFDHYWELQNDCSASLRASLAALTEGERTRLRHAAAASAAQHTQDGVLRLPGAPLCASARKPA